MIFVSEVRENEKSYQLLSFDHCVPLLLCEVGSIDVSDTLKPLCWKNISFIRFVTILEVFTVLCHSFSPVSSFPANYVRKREENNYQKAGTCKLGIERRSSDPVACEQSFYHNFACLWALAQCLEWKSSRVLCRKQLFGSPSWRFSCQQKNGNKKNVALVTSASTNK